MNDDNPARVGPGLWVVLVLVLAIGFGLPVTAVAQEDERVGEVKRMTDEAMRLRKEGRLAEAIVVWKRRLALVREIVGTEYAESVAGSLEILAEMQEAQGDLAGAARSLRGVVDVRERLQGKDHWRVTDARQGLVRLGRLQNDGAEARRKQEEIDRYRVRAFQAYKAKDYAAAAEHQQKALELQREWLGESPEVANSLGALALFAQRRKDYAAAVRFYEQALALRRKMLGEHPDTARSLRDLATARDQAGDREDSLHALAEAVPMFTRTLGEEHPESVQALESLASARFLLGDFGAAQVDCERLLRIRRKLHGTDSRQAAAALVRLGAVQGSVGNQDGYRKCLEEGLEIYARRPIDHDLDRAEALDQLGWLSFGQQDHARARECFEQSYRIRAAALGEDDLRTLESREGLAVVLEKKGDVAEARKEMEKVTQAVRRARGRDPLLTYRLQSLARLSLQQNDAEAARTLLEEALSILKEHGAGLVRAHCDTLAALAAVDAYQDHWQQAEARMDESRRLLRPFLSRALWELSEAEQLAYLGRSDRISFQQALALGAARPEDRSLVERSAAWLLNGKGVAQEVLAERSLLSRDAPDSELGGLLKRWRAVRGELARRAFRAAQAEPDEALARLETEEQDLSRQISRAGGRVAPQRSWRELEEVRKALPADAVFIDLARYHGYDFRAAGRRAWQPPRYAAWVVPPAGAGEVHLIHLGEAKGIEEAVEAVRKGLREAPATIKDRGEPEAEKELRRPLEALARQVLWPLLPHVKDSHQWILSPDAALWLVPWAALPLPEGLYAVQKHVLRQVVSGRDLLPASRYRGEVGPALILADPDFDLDPAQARRLAPTPAQPDALRGTGRSLRIGRVRRLPFSAAEAALVQPALERLTGSPPRLCTDKEALESIFKATRHPRVVVLSTHGFFLEGPEDLPAEQLGVVDQRGLKPGRPQDNPLLRCGLLLAGCNRREEAATADEDGVLSGLEIVTADLRGTELVVLSACETGLGQVRTGEGVAGLRQAFHLAGARGVLATLWQVPDRDTALLVSGFFNERATGADSAAALRTAQRAAIRRRQESEGAAHPLYWAAFALTGE
jgi:CHAT domain-containing protein/tetratricopeptide (TPR) repeat protein